MKIQLKRSSAPVQKIVEKWVWKPNNPSFKAKRIPLTKSVQKLPWFKSGGNWQITVENAGQQKMATLQMEVLLKSMKRKRVE